MKLLGALMAGFAYMRNELELKDYPENDNWKKVTLGGAYDSETPTGALFACVSIMTGLFSRLPHEVYRRYGRFESVDRRSPLNDLLHQPAPHMTGHTLKELMYWDTFSNGNGVSEIISSSDGYPVELAYCKLTGKLRRDTTSGMVYGVVYPRENGLMVNGEVEARNLLHFRWDGYDIFDGISPSPIETHAINTWGLHLASLKHQNVTLNKGFSARNVIETDAAIRPKTLIDFREKIQELYSGNINAGKVPILFPGMKANQLGWSSVDLQLIEILKYTVTDLARVYKIPLHLLQADERTSGWSGNSLPDRWLNFERVGVLPHSERFGAEMSFKLMPPPLRNRHNGIRINTDSLTESNLPQMAKTVGELVTKRIWTPNEARERTGKRPLPGGDELISAPVGGANQNSGNGNNNGNDQGGGNGGKDDGNSQSDR